MLLIWLFSCKVITNSFIHFELPIQKLYIILLTSFYLLLAVPVTKISGAGIPFKSNPMSVKISIKTIEVGTMHPIPAKDR